MKSPEKPFIIPIFIPHAGCPHLCAFCNQNTITGTGGQIPSVETLRDRTETFLGYKRPERENVEIAFYGGNFLGLKSEEIRRLLNEAARFVRQGRVGSIRFSTRPDTVTEERLEILGNFPVSVIEIGAQSMNDEVLARSMRGHTARDTEIAAELLRKHGYVMGIQMMTGLPGDTEATIMETGRRIAALGPAFVRIYPTLVIEGSLLAHWYRTGQYCPMSLEDAVRVVKTLYPVFAEKNIAVIRMGLQASADLEPGASIVAGPYHPAFGHLVLSEIFLDKSASVMVSANAKGKNIRIRVHPERISRLRGEGSKNIAILKNRFGFASLEIIPDKAVSREEIIIGERRFETDDR